ncbi:MAG: hypothetical protein Q9174_007376, partial [Haloplaca sp. 1 TL-2023]
MDEERRAGKLREKLHGIPMLVKDQNMATCDRMETTAGSWALLGSQVAQDAYVVERLRRAGVVVLGHGNMGEWASVRSSKYSTGFSPRGGSAVAVAANIPLAKRLVPTCAFQSPARKLALDIFSIDSSGTRPLANSLSKVPLAFGTETDTSIIGPAAINGIVGIKPTVGLTSRSGVIPISKNFDTVGPFGRTVADAVHGLDAIIDPDEDDPMTLDPHRPETKDYSAFLSSRSALKAARFGLPQKRCWECVAASNRNVAKRLFKAIEHAGGEIIPTDFPCAEERIASDGSWD